MTVLLLAHRYDISADLLERELAALDAPFARIHPADLPARLHLTASLDGDEGGSNWRGRISLPHRVLEIEQLTAVHNRRRGDAHGGAGSHDPGLRIEARPWAVREAHRAFYGILHALPLRWVNRPDTAATASLAPLQLAAALGCGLRVPEALLTNNTADARAFGAAGPADYRALRGVPASDSRREELRRSLLLHSGGALPAGTDLHVGDGVRNPVCHLTRPVPHAYDVCVAVVGAEVFAARVRYPAEARGHDRRRWVLTDEVGYAETEVPGEVRSRMREFTRRLGLAYALLWFSVDRDGRWWFVEADPHGSWLAMQQADPAAFPIAEALAALLAADAAPAARELPAHAVPLAELP